MHEFCNVFYGLFPWSPTQKFLWHRRRQTYRYLPSVVMDKISESLKTHLPGDQQWNCHIFTWVLSHLPCVVGGRVEVEVVVTGVVAVVVVALRATGEQNPQLLGQAKRMNCSESWHCPNCAQAPHSSAYWLASVHPVLSGSSGSTAADRQSTARQDSRNSASLLNARTGTFCVRQNSRWGTTTAVRE